MLQCSERLRGRRARWPIGLIVTSSDPNVLLKSTTATGSLFSRAANPPDGPRTVVGHQQRAVGSNGDAHRAPPNVSIVNDKSRHEVLIFTARVTSLMQRYTYYFITHAHRAIPGSMFAGKDIALIVRRELFAFIESHLQLGIVRVQDHIGGDDFVF